MTPPPVKPNELNAAAFELVMVRFDAVPVCRVTALAATAEPEPPDKVSILLSKAVTVLVTSIWFAPEAPETTKVSV